MTPATGVEARIADLISTFADSAPADDDLRHVAMLAIRGRAAEHDRLPTRALAWMALVLALVATLAVGALAAGRLLDRDPGDLLVSRPFVPPFTGLPPVGVEPSAPEAGELVVGFIARVRALGNDVHEMYLYADGRLIWQRNLESSGAAALAAFGSSTPTTAVIEQRLTREGVDRVRSYVDDVATVGPVSGPGVFWGVLSIGDGSSKVRATWSDGDLPLRLSDPGSWLPASAWADQRLQGYVPSRIAVCVNLEAGLDTDFRSEEVRPRMVNGVVPLAVSRILEDQPRVTGSWAGAVQDGCAAVAVDEARVIVAMLEEAGFRRDDEAGGALVLSAPAQGDAEARFGWEVIRVRFAEVLPDDGVVCYCG